MVILKKCRGLKVGQESRRAPRQALSLINRRKNTKRTANWYIIPYLKVSMISSKILRLS